MHLAAIVSTLLLTYDEVNDEQSTVFQEDCAGHGLLTAGVQTYHLPAAKRDVP